MIDPSETTGRVSRYYDRNTRFFLRFGRGSGSTGAIHRALRAPGVRTQIEALHYVHTLIADLFVRYGTASPNDGLHGSPGVRGGGAELAGDPPEALPRIADLGCGIGASMEYLARRLAARFVGVTISPVQAEIARAAIAAANERPGVPRDRIGVVVGDFTTAESLFGPGNLAGAYMIESFVHGPSAGQTLGAIATCLPPGGILVICDDIPSEELIAMPECPEERSITASRHHRIGTWVKEFRRGWHVDTFEPESRLTAVAAEHALHLVESIDLSPYVVVDRPRDRLIRLIAGPARRLGARSPWWENIRGGNALQQLEKAGLMEYRLLVFRKSGPELSDPASRR